MRIRSSLPILMLAITLTLVISPSLGIQMSVGISSRGIINYPEEATPRLHITNTEIRDPNEKKVILRGVNFATHHWWTLEKGTEQQFIYMKGWGASVVRITIDGWALPKWKANPSFRSKMDQMISWAEKHGMYVVLSGYHVWPGGPTSETNSDLSWWGDAEWNNWIEHWKDIATRYKGRTNVLYDLLNEAYNISWATYQKKMRACIDAIRAIDPDVICIVQSMSNTNNWGDHSFQFETQYPISRTNVLFSSHGYYWFATGGTSKSDIRSFPITKRYWKWMLDNNRAVWIGECNAKLETFPNGGTWLRNFYEVLNEDGYSGYAAWAWKVGEDFPLLLNWDGAASPLGSILQEYLL